VDSEDLPLNISRETMQDTSLMQKLNKVLTTRFLKFLDETAEKDPETYEKFYAEYQRFLKEGIVTDFTHKDALGKLVRYESSHTEKGKTTSLADYVKRMSSEQKEIYCLQVPNRDAAEASPYYEVFRERKFEVLFLYDAWDVSALLRPGCNAIGVMLGAGWYSEPSVKVGPRSLIAMLSVMTADGAKTYFASSLTPGANSLVFSSTVGPVTSDNIYAGENYDARLEQPGFAACAFTPPAPWLPAVAAPDPRTVHGSVMSWQSPASAPMIDRDYSVAAITTPSDGVYVVDFAQNMAGTTTFKVVCPNGPQWIYMAYGESLHPDGTVLNQYGNIMNSNFTCAGTGDVETYKTLFSYYGFRYVQLTNFPGVPDEGTFTAHLIHSAVGQTGAFNSDNDLLNNIQHCTRFASLSNLMDVPTDCPQRERA
jgi:hypothetical protein